MARRQTWMVAAGGLAALLGALWLALVWFIPGDEDLAAHAAGELQGRLGVPVRLGALHWRLLPVPAVVLEDVATDQPQPITVKKLTAYPDLLALLQRRVILDRVELDGAVVPQLSLRALDATPRGAAAEAGAMPLARFVFRDLTWLSRHGVAVVYDGEIDFDPGWRPRQAVVRRPGFTPATDLTLTRQGQEDRWAAHINVGGGTANGEVQLQTRADGRLVLDGQLRPSGVDVASAVAAFNRKPVIAGKATGNTVLSAQADTLVGLAQSLHTKTVFTMGASTLLRFDLDKAVRSFGKDHAGQTPLDAVSGQLATQNTPRGMVTNFTGIKARSGALTASGQARLSNRQIEAEFAVDLVDGIVGVPLVLSGPVDKVAVSVSGGAVAGAVLGTAVLPGIGTAIGARLGATLGRLFDSGPDRQPGKAAPATPGTAP
ncbi:MAG: AsmA-like C-terminal region-containing protein [Polaromonas sp.]|uniref:AsmA-like C-terminal region-containing protein n=1 Tax=Polaromonas sp. TaxID=1869339 RepID=UPI0024896072|nr:AsmA-like C-terminal region-containing protein [Polaromonas sp.]MDI1271198.1 AsmA-like C-terminal region-containing protein [Polaromonas sp.]